MKDITLFSLAVDEAFWKTGSKSSLKMLMIKLFKPGCDLKEQIKKYAQARIPNHREVEVIWAMITPALTKIRDPSFYANNLPIERQ